MSAQLAAASLVEFPSPSTPKKRPSAKLSHHSRCCTICPHADRPEIEDDFLHWRPSTEIASEFGLPDRRAVYRHARATGLYQRRMKNMRIASSYIVQHADRVTPNAKQVLDAVRACSLIDATGTWNEPIRHVIIEHINAPQPAPASADLAPEIAAPAPPRSFSTVYSVQLESAATPTKQTPAPSSTVYSSEVSQYPVSPAQTPATRTAPHPVRNATRTVPPPVAAGEPALGSAGEVDSGLDSGRDAHQRAAHADNTVRATKAVWLSWSPGSLLHRLKSWRKR